MPQPIHKVRRVIAQLVTRASVLSLCLGVAVLLAYWPMHRNGFIDTYDDVDYVLENRHVRTGLTWENAQWAFSRAHAANWHPATWLSHMLDCTFYGPEPGGHHFTSLLIHAANAILLFLLLRAGTGATWRSLLVAALFALHPINVESVAWVSERKNTLSTLFGLAAVGFYGTYAHGRRWPAYAASLAACALSLMAKPMLVTLPFALLLLDWWPLERLRITRLRGPAAAPPTVRTRVVLEKLPFLLLATASSIVTVLTQRTAGAVARGEVFPLATRCAHAAVTVWRYAGKLVWPADLVVFYPHGGMPGAVPLVLSVSGIAAVVIACTVLARRVPWLPVGCFWFLGTLVPVIGLVQVGAQAMADRYAYVPLIGLFVVVAWSAGAAAVRWTSARMPLAALLTAVVASLAVATFGQVQVWQSSATLFEHVLTVSPENPVAHNNLGLARMRAGDLAGATAHFEDAIRLRPTHLALNNLGVVMHKQGDAARAREYFEAALRISSTNSDALYNLGLVYCQLGDTARGIASYEKTIAVCPECWQAHLNLGMVLAGHGDNSAAVGCFTRALALVPGNAKVRLNRARAYLALGEHERAEIDCRRVLERYPADTALANHVARMLEQRSTSTRTSELRR